MIYAIIICVLFVIIWCMIIAADLRLLNDKGDKNE